MKRTPLKKISSMGTLQRKCDKLLSPIIIKRLPTCLLCPNPTQVAHHHVHKSKSNRLRYDFINLINLCHKCHMALHHNESYNASRIVVIKGIKWFEELELLKRESIKVNKGYYEGVLERLTNLYDKTN